MNPYPLPDLKAPRCAIPYPDAGQPWPRGRYVPVRFAGGTCLVPEQPITRAVQYADGRLCDAGVLLLSLYGSGDDAFFAGRGLGPAWKADFAGNVSALRRLGGAHLGSSAEGAVRGLFLGDDDHAVVLIRDVLRIADTAGVRVVFGRRAADLQSQAGRQRALKEIGAIATVPEVRERMAGLGLTDDLVAQVGDLEARLAESAARRLASHAAQDLSALAIAKGVILGDLMVASKLARGLPAQRAAAYRLAALLRTPARRRGDSRSATPPDGAGSTPPATGEAQPAASPATGQAPATPNATAQAPPAASPAAAPVPAPGPALVPGMVLTIHPAAGEAPRLAVVQLDGTLAWLATPEK